MVDKNRVLAELDESIRRGNFLQAIDVAGRNLSETGSPLFRKPLALALSRMGHTEEALSVLKPLIEMGNDPETDGLVAGILKRTWLSTGETEVLEKSYQFYLKSFVEGGEYWSGINAATLARIMDKSISSKLADEVLNICWEEYGRLGTRSSFWLLVSIAEAHLVKGDTATASKWYKLVTPMAYRSIGQVKAVRQNAKLLSEKLGEESLVNLMEAIYSPRVAVFSGHRIDREGMPTRFPQRETESVKKRLRASLGKMKIAIGVASLADGADILFHECLIEAGRQCRVILPSPVNEFRRKLAHDDPGGWVNRFDKVLEAASGIEIVSRSVYAQDWSIVYEFATDYMLGYSMSLADDIDGTIVPLVVWDKKVHARRGGTYSAVKKLRSLGYEPEVVTVFPQSYFSETVGSKIGSMSNDREHVPSKSFYVVIGVADKVGDDEGIADTLSLYIETVKQQTSLTKTVPVKKTVRDKDICLAFTEIIPAVQFIRKFREKHPDCCIFAHVGLSIRFNVSLSLTGDSYSPALLEAISLVRMLSAGQTFCSIAFKSFTHLENLKELEFFYGGQFTLDDRDIKIFQMNIND